MINRTLRVIKGVRCQHEKDVREHEGKRVIRCARDEKWYWQRSCVVCPDWTKKEE